MKNAPIYRDVVYDYYERILKDACQVHHHQYIEVHYRTGKIDFSVCYGNQKQYDFFHPSIANIEVAEKTSQGLKIYVFQDAAINFDDFLKKMEFSEFEQADILYKVGNLDNVLAVKQILPWQRTFKYLNVKRKLAFFIMDDLKYLPEWERSFSFKNLLNRFLILSSYQIIHGAGISWNNKGCILTARGGSGKSTTTINCLMQGMTTVGDDMILVDVDQQSFHNLYSIAKLKPEVFMNAEIFQKMESKAINSRNIFFKEHNQKYHLQLNELFPKKVIQTSPVDCILIPVITGNAAMPRFEKADAQACANAILPSTLKLLEGNKQKIVQKIQQFIQKVPSFYFHLSTDLKENPKVLKDFLSGKIA